MKKLYKMLLVGAVCLVGYLTLAPVYLGDTPYDKAEFDYISAFLIYQRQYTETYHHYCQQQNYRLETLSYEFKQRHAGQIAAAKTFLDRFRPEERLAFYRELNRVYAELEPDIFTQLEQSYQKNRHIYTSAGQSLSRYDFCQWMDTHPDILFKGKTDKEYQSGNFITK